jgi:lysozyme
MYNYKRTIKIIKESEDLVLKPYQCFAGVHTIGYGHVIKKGKEGLKNGITQKQAELILEDDINYFVTELSILLKAHNVSLNQNQYGALVSFCFNLGIERFKTSTLFKRIIENPMNFYEIKKQINRFVYATDPKTNKKVKLNGLVIRRGKEARLYEKPTFTIKELTSTVPTVMDIVSSPVSGALELMGKYIKGKNKAITKEEILENLVYRTVEQIKDLQSKIKQDKEYLAIKKQIANTELKKEEIKFKTNLMKEKSTNNNKKINAIEKTAGKFLGLGGDTVIKIVGIVCTGLVIGLIAIVYAPTENVKSVVSALKGNKTVNTNI